MNRITLLKVAGFGAGLTLLGSSGQVQTRDGLAGMTAHAAQRFLDTLSFLGTLTALECSRASYAFSEDSGVL